VKTVSELLDLGDKEIQRQIEDDLTELDDGGSPGR